MDLEQLKAKFPEVEFSTLPDGANAAKTPVEKYREFAQAARDLGGYAHLSCLSGADYKDRLQVGVHLYKMESKAPALVIHCDLDRENPRIPSVTDLWPTANWHEREAYDMYGIIFDNHPRFIRILLPDNWQGGHPLRKDFVDKRPRRPRLVRYRGDATN